MQRRKFFGSILAGAALAATWKTSLAAGNGQESLAAKAKDKLRNDTSSLKGFCCSDMIPARVNPLNADWLHTIFGPWCGNHDLRVNAKWSFHLFDLIPARQDVENAVSHPDYENWWLTLNEPDLSGMSALDAVALVQQQMDVVLGVNPRARFCLGMGSQLNGVMTATPWFPALWERLPDAYKVHIHAFHTHYYSQSEPGIDHEGLFSPIPMERYLRGCRKWMNRNANEFRRELWITEIGLVLSGPVAADPRLPLYPLLVQQAMDGLAERWAWYSMSKRDGYATLMELDNSGQTPLGKVFAGMSPGTYPLRPARKSSDTEQGPTEPDCDN